MTEQQEKAMRMALEALDCLPWQASPIAVEATQALRQALAQPEQECTCSVKNMTFGKCCKAQPEQEPEAWVKQEFKLYDDNRIDKIDVLIRARDAILSMRTDSCPAVKGTILMADTNESLLDVLNRAIQARR